MQEISVKVTKYADRENLVMYYRDPVTEKLVTRSAETSNPKLAAKAAGKWENQLREGRYQSSRGLTWAQFRERYEQEKGVTLSLHAQQTAAAAFNHLETLIAPKKLGSLTAGLLSKFQTELRNYRRKESTGTDADGEPTYRLMALSETSIGAYLTYLKAALGWAVKMKLLREVPEIEMPQQAKGRTMMRGRPITGEEFDRMIATVPAVRPNDAPAWERLLRGLWLSGLRIEEATIVSWDPDAGFSIDLTGRRPRFRIYAEAHKGRRDQFLPMTPDFAEFILATPEAERHGLVFKVTSQTSGNQMSLKRIGRAIGVIGEKAGAVVNKEAQKYATAHDFRRAFGSRWARQVAPAVLKQLMRHKSIDTTMKYYVDLDADDVADALWSKHAPINKSFNTAPSEAPEGEKPACGASSQSLAAQDD